MKQTLFPHLIVWHYSGDSEQTFITEFYGADKQDAVNAFATFNGIAYVPISVVALPKSGQNTANHSVVYEVANFQSFVVQDN